MVVNNEFYPWALYMIQYRELPPKELYSKLNIVPKLLETKDKETIRKEYFNYVYNSPTIKEDFILDDIYNSNNFDKSNSSDESDESDESNSLTNENFKKYIIKNIFLMKFFLINIF